MILVPHYVDRSAIEGLGLFCAAALQTGQAIYRYDWRFVMIISETELCELPEAMQQAVLKYSYRGRGTQRLSGAMYYCADDARFMNHADEPSTLWDEDQGQYVAARDLPAGAELTCDYRDFCEPEDCEFEL
ncbi:MAG: lysine methyltransferase [Hydrocarboniphaga sp.]|uniref:SET domain-containing protein n=1 Tax=Hydrocarboniphaga sp. TaxID=2033016 RepID=UPI002639B89E|nr:SET domain-containing protein [Hydrocarboniphaga sp.]MDB5970948.1 lysine methyltransferase [Hydrocarboniphaga sp.]